MFENVGGGELLLILLVVLIFFGPKKIPELAASMGKGLRKFNEAKEGIETQVKTAMKEPLDAISGASQGFEAKMREIAEPLHAELKIPANQAQPTAPAIPIMATTQPRTTATPAAETPTPAEQASAETGNTPAAHAPGTEPTPAA